MSASLSNGLGPLISEVRKLIVSARRGVAAAVNTLQVLTNFEIGRRIVEYEQGGAARAEYGKGLLKELSTRLTEEFGRGFSVTNLKLMRQFFMANRHRIGQTATDQFPLKQIGQKASDQLNSISQKPSGSPFSLSWSHYV
ncbi:MAG: DUF1016 N-terminal domain-containing protein, partial [Acidobacteriota bacterium]